MMQLPRLSLVLSTALLCILSTSCVPTSPQPVLTASSSKNDEELLGTWWTDHGEPFEIYRGKPKTNTLTLKFEKHLLYLRTAKLKNLRLMTATFSTRSGRGSIQLLKYRISSQGHLEVYVLKPEPIAQAIKTGALQGKVVLSKPGPFSTSKYSRLEITDSPSRILRFLDKHSKEVFREQPGFRCGREKSFPRNQNGFSLRLLFKPE